MNTTTFNITIDFLTPILGTIPKDRKVFETHIQSKAADKGEGHGGLSADELKAEVESIEEVEERGTTGFFTNAAGTPYLFDYQIKGFFKEVGNTLKGDKQLNVTALKSKIDQYVFIRDRRNPFIPGESMSPCESDMDELIVWAPQNGHGYRQGTIERPLRAETAKGPRVSLARSDVLGNVALSFGLVVFNSPAINGKLLQDILAYGQFKGTGQWRNGGWGRFTVRSFDELG